MTYQEMMENAKLSMGLYCKACPVCDGRACKNQIPGPGAKGVGDTAIRNYKKWQEIRVNMDTICDGGEADTSVNLFGKEFKMPFFAGPVGAVNLHYSDRYDDVSYNNVLVSACADAGIAAFTGDGVNAKVMEAATEAIRENDGCGIPTVKPWNLDTVREKMELVKKSGAFAVAMDIDAAGLPFLKNMNPPAGSKNVQELSEIVKMAGRPFIVKGVMTAKGARKAKEAGADAIIVSNHGGRVLDQCPATAMYLQRWYGTPVFCRRQPLSGKCMCRGFLDWNDKLGGSICTEYDCCGISDPGKSGNDLLVLTFLQWKQMLGCIRIEAECQ